MSRKWAKLPTWWITQGIEGIDSINFLTGELIPGLRLFRVRETGASIAALKLYIALTIVADNYDKTDTPGIAVLSLAELEDATGMSRAMVVKASKFLERHKLVSIERGKGKRNAYLLEGYEKVPWMKIPKKRFNKIHDERAEKDTSISKGSTLSQISLRGKVNLNALKLYLFLAASVDRKIGAACRTYKTIEKNTGILRNDIRPAISVLISFQLIKVSHEKLVNDENPYNSPNIYYICDID